MIRGVLIGPRNCVKRIALVQQSQAAALRKTVPLKTAWNNGNSGSSHPAREHHHSSSSQVLGACSGCCSRWIQAQKELIWRNVLILSKLLTKQCEFVAAQRLRRAYQIWCLHSQLYSDITLKRMVSKLGRRLLAQQRPLGVLLGAALFNWEKENIQDGELERCACDLIEIETLLGKQLPNAQGLKAANCEPQDAKNWELVINKEHLKVWRKAMKKTTLYEYKVFGTYYDIPARAFFRVQVDTEYRKTWDNLVIKLDIVERMNDRGDVDKQKSASEVVHWVMHYPYPMYSRDYVYVRRYLIDDDNKLMVFVSRSTNHPSVPVDSSYVRVTTYKSQMVIRPHDGFDDNGFDYVLTYFDDPHAIFPGPAYNWMASSGVPEFVKKLHNAAKMLVQVDKQKRDAEENEDDDGDEKDAPPPQLKTLKKKKKWKLRILS